MFKYKSRNTERTANWARDRTSAGLCTRCGASMGDDPCVRCKVCRTKQYVYERQPYRVEHLGRLAAGRYEKKRKKIVDTYGGKCACCGEDEYLFLQLDHVNNDGAAHRRELGKTNIVDWIVRNNYPKSIQVLCANCNMCKRVNKGVCIHAGAQLETAGK